MRDPLAIVAQHRTQNTNKELIIIHARFDFNRPHPQVRRCADEGYWAAAGVAMQGLFVLEMQISMQCLLHCGAVSARNMSSEHVCV